MLPRVPTAPHGMATRPCRRLGPCRFVSGADVAHYLQQEVVIEGVLHVSAAQAGSCMERFGDIDAARAPALPPLEDVLAGAAEPQLSSSSSSTSKGNATATASPFAGAGSGRASPAGASARGGSGTGPINRAGSTGEGASRVLNEAFCLATPPENPTENNSPLRGQPQPNSSARTAMRTGSSSALPERLQLSPGRAQLRVGSSNASASSLSNSEAEELLQMEGAASTYQYAYARAALSAQALYANEALQASAAVRRRRRRVLVRLLRQGRERTAAGLSVLQDSPPGQLLASISASISSLSSWDDDGGAVGGPQHLGQAAAAQARRVWSAVAAPTAPAKLPQRLASAASVRSDWRSV